MHGPDSFNQGDMLLASAALNGMGYALQWLRLPRSIVLTNLRVLETRVKGPVAQLVIEAMLRISGDDAELSLKLSSEGLRIESYTEKNNERTHVITRIVTELPSSMLRDTDSLDPVARAIANIVTRVLGSLASIISGYEKRPVVIQGTCYDDPAEAVLQLLDMLVDAYGPVRGLALFDEYLEKPGVILVENVLAYPLSDRLCFATITSR